MAMKTSELTALKPQPRDLQILQMLGKARYMNGPQLTALFWQAGRGGDLGAQKAAQRRLKKMRETGLLRVTKQWLLLGEGTRPLIYALTQAGAGLVSLHYGIDPRTIEWKPKPFEENYLFLHHLMASHDLGVAISVSCAKYGFTLETWLHELELRRQGMQEHVQISTQANGAAAQETKRVMVVPDDFFVVNTGRGRGHFPAEIDRGTETLARWREKIQGYLAYHASGAYERRYGGRNFRLLTVTTTPERLQHLKQVTEEVAAGDKRFMFTTFDQVSERQPARYTYQQPGTDKKKLFYKVVYNDELLTQSVWHRSGDTAMHSLLE